MEEKKPPSVRGLNEMSGVDSSSENVFGVTFQ